MGEMYAIWERGNPTKRDFLYRRDTLQGAMGLAEQRAAQTGIAHEVYMLCGTAHPPAPATWEPTPTAQIGAQS